jgi:16S rRNA G966 N2-methylase RsmD
MIRITTGIYKGRKLQIPKGIRPTQNITRKAVFDIIGDIEGLVFLELFAGSGAVGIEAASRGAREVVFVENNPQTAKALGQNLSCLPQGKFYVLPLDAQLAVKRLGDEGRKFDVIFLDPPYLKEPATPGLKGMAGVPLSASTPGLKAPWHKGLPSASIVDGMAGVPLSAATPNLKGKVGVPPSAVKNTLQTLSACDILTPAGLIIAQHSKKEDLPEHLGVLSLLKQSRYGDSILSFYRKNVPESNLPGDI